MTDLHARQAELLARRDQLQTRLDAIRRDFANGLSADSEERAQQLENAEVLNEIGRVTAEELATVNAALERLEQALRQG